MDKKLISTDNNSTKGETWCRIMLPLTLKPFFNRETGNHKGPGSVLQDVYDPGIFVTPKK